MVKLTLSPSSIVVVDTPTSNVGIGASFTVMVLDVATIVAVVDADPVLIWRLNVSDPSISRSFDKILVIVAIPVAAPVLTMLNEPVRELSEKSFADTVPVVV